MSPSRWEHHDHATRGISSCGPIPTEFGAIIVRVLCKLCDGRHSSTRIESTNRKTQRSTIIGFMRIRSLLFCSFFVLGLAPYALSQDPLPRVESVDAATRTRWLINGTVVDRQTKQPVKAFSVTPGTTSIDATGKTTIRWRENLKREMTNGAFQWPRTSGFSVMRFRVTASGYDSAVTHKINRGGPHIRLRVQLNRSPKTPTL